MRRSLPTAGKHARNYNAPPSPVERKDPGVPVIAIAQATSGNTGVKLAAELVKALVAEGLAVNALVTADDPSADAQSALTQLAAAGAKHVSVVRTAREHPELALAPALLHFATDELLVVLGNSLPFVYRPFFCIVVNPPRTTHLPEAQALRVRADLEVPAPAEALVLELAKLLARRHRQTPPRA